MSENAISKRKRRDPSLVEPAQGEGITNYPEIRKLERNETMNTNIPTFILWVGLLTFLFVYLHSSLIIYNFNFLNYPYLNGLI